VRSGVESPCLRAFWVVSRNPLLAALPAEIPADTRGFRWVCAAGLGSSAQTPGDLAGAFLRVGSEKLQLDCSVRHAQPGVRPLTSSKAHHSHRGAGFSRKALCDSLPSESEPGPTSAAQQGPAVSSVRFLPCLSVTRTRGHSRDLREWALPAVEAKHARTVGWRLRIGLMSPVATRRRSG
jgi:hypothetical protein